jgi:hypothetical protein
MTHNSRKGAAVCPPAVAIHNNCYMLRQFFLNKLIFSMHRKNLVRISDYVWSAGIIDFKKVNKI